MTDVTSTNHLLDLSRDDLHEFCKELELPRFRVDQILEWVYRKGATDFDQMTNLSKTLRQQLANRWRVFVSETSKHLNARDGTTKLLLEWPDGATSECVLIPDDRRRTACISSQVGCPVGCRFCASGLDGVQRNLSTGQIVEQVMRVQSLCDERHPLSNIVFMGLGEPLANYRNVVEAVRILNADWGLNFGARRITISTVGLPKQIKQLAREGLQVNLAISLHAPNDKLRRQLIPWAEKISLDELIEAGREYFDVTGREVTLEYILLREVNDKVYHAHELVKVCRKMRCNVNLIRYNPVESLDFERPSSFSVMRFQKELRERGVNAHVRKSRGLDIDAACGQLRRRDEQDRADEPITIRRP